jgi:hypothetical protein
VAVLNIRRKARSYILAAEKLGAAVRSEVDRSHKYCKLASLCNTPRFLLGFNEGAGRESDMSENNSLWLEIRNSTLHDNQSEDLDSQSFQDLTQQYLEGEKQLLEEKPEDDNRDCPSNLDATIISSSYKKNYKAIMGIYAECWKLNLEAFAIFKRVLREVQAVAAAGEIHPPSKEHDPEGGPADVPSPLNRDLVQLVLILKKNKPNSASALTALASMKYNRLTEIEKFVFEITLPYFVDDFTVEGETTAMIAKELALVPIAVKTLQRLIQRACGSIRLHRTPSSSPRHEER